MRLGLLGSVREEEAKQLLKKRADRGVIRGVGRIPFYAAENRWYR